MNLYLMRHCEAEDGPREDPTRALTSIGRQQAVTMGEFLQRQIGRVDIVLTSYFARARGTASPIAELLGCELIIDTPMLEPAASAKDAWREIQFLAGNADDVLVVTHHPLVNDLLDLLTGCSSEKFKHGAVALIASEFGTVYKLHWFVPPSVVERDEDAVLNAAAALTEALTAEVREAKKGKTGLLHPRHQATLTATRAKLKRLFSGYFDRQGAAIMAAVEPHIQSVISQYQEASATGKRFASTLVPVSLHPLKFAATSEEESEYESAITGAITGAGLTLAKELKAPGAELKPTVASDYLRDNSLSKLTGGFEDTTISRLQSAIADAWDAGGSFDQITAAIKGTMEDFSDTRAEMIAQTEGNAAYNAGRQAMADDWGATEKSWETESGDPCQECLDNEDAGWIGIDEDFPSGNDIPLHPNCACNLNFGKSDFGG